MKNYLPYINNRFISIVLVVVFSVVLIAACVDKPSGYKPRAIGSPGEVLVVIEDSLWSSSVGTLLADLLEDEFPALPQIESMFRKTRIDYSQFQRHFRTYRNVLLLRVNEEEKDSKVEYRKHEWAKNQQVATVVGSNIDELGDLIQKKWPKIKSFFHNGDITSMSDSYLRVYDAESVDFIQSMYPFTMYFPKGFHLKKNDQGFSWLSAQNLGYQMGVFVYQCSLDSLKQNDSRGLLEFRNNLLMHQVPGEVDGSYMTTEDLFPVQVRQSSFGGKKWTELRGLWKVEGDLMGGPFVDYFYKDEVKNELLLLSAYVYAPAKPKKALYMREAEAVLKSFKVN